MNDAISLKSISDIRGCNFFIPKYQRGYRWSEQQVADLLNDIKEFMENSNLGENEIYCLQPLVVKKREEDTLKKIKETANTLQEVEMLLKGTWDVIDGQQRLTTIKILLTYLEHPSYPIEYETRKTSEDFLDNILQKRERDAKNNIDFYHMWQANKTIKAWFENNGDKQKEFLQTLLDKVKFIWYESTNEDPISVFTRLNIGKIPLTDAELIKALFLNQSNFSNSENADTIRLYQQEIAAEWDNIEYALQNDEFWLFIHNLGWTNPTRIDFIFDLMQEKNELKLSNDQQKNIGTDEHKTFRYFYEYFNVNKDSINGDKLRDYIWGKVKKYFQTFQEWFNDLELYHYVGYLVARGMPLASMLDKWNDQAKDKKSFKEYLIEEIKNKLNNCNDLVRNYCENGDEKTKCLPLLLLFNIQTVINQNKELVRSEKYGLGAFYKFPFHLFKKEAKKDNGKGWEIEHIASNAGDDFDSQEKQQIYLAGIKFSLSDENPLKSNINNFLNGTQQTEFKDIYEKCEQQLSDLKTLPDVYKNYIWNFALLDSATNEEYQNSPFPVKRICVLAKDRGQKATLQLNENKELQITYKEGIAFVPPCTRNVFTKAYTDIPTALNAWTAEDAENYLRKINETLFVADFIDDQSEAIDNFINLTKYPEVYNG